jgi:hypothetical protein
VSLNIIHLAKPPIFGGMVAMGMPQLFRMWLASKPLTRANCNLEMWSHFMVFTLLLTLETEFGWTATSGMTASVLCTGTADGADGFSAQ